METNKKQTAVEYLIDRINCTSIDTLITLHNCGYLDKAKQMEREQIEIAFSKSHLIGLAEVKYDDVNREANRYYQNTYGK